MPTLADLEAAAETAVTDLEKIQALNGLAIEVQNTDTLRAKISVESVLRLIGERQDFPHDKATALLTLSWCAFRLSQYAEALRHAIEARSLFEQVNDKAGAASSVSNIGNVYAALADYPNALKYHQESLAIYQTLGYTKGIAMSLGNIGNVYGILADYPNALKHHQDSLSLKRTFGDKRGIAASLGNLGKVYRILADYPNALKHHQESLRLWYEAGDKRGAAITLISLGALYSALGDYPNALRYYQDSLDGIRALGDKSGTVSSLIGIGSMFIATRRYEEAETYLQEALAISDELGLLSNRFGALQTLAELYAETGQFEKAYRTHVEFHRAEKAVFDDEKQKALNLLQVRYKTEQAEQQAELQKKETQLAQLKNVELANALSDAELQRHRAEQANQFKSELLSIAAHDLKNPLQSVLGFSELIQEETDLDVINRYSAIINNAADRMVNLIDHVLESSSAELGQLRLNKTAEEIGALLESVVLDRRHQVQQKDQRISYDIEPELMAVVDKERLRDVFENVISNAIKYTATAKGIEVRAKKVADADSGKNLLLISVKDEGQGLSADDLQKLFGRFQRLSARPTGGESSTGLGLYIVKQVVELHGGKVWAESDGKGKGSTFFIHLPALQS